MIFQNLFSEKNKKNITNLSSAELAQRVENVNVIMIKSQDNLLEQTFQAFKSPLT